MSEMRKVIVDVLHSKFETPMEKLENPKTPFGDLGLDSLDLVDLIIEFEDRTKSELDFEEMKGVQTVGEFLDKLEAAFAQPPALSP